MLDIGILSGHLLKDIIPKNHVILQAIGFCGTHHLFTLVTTRILESITYDALGAFAGKYRCLDRHLVLRALIETTTGTSILTLGVLAHTDDIDILGLLIGQRAMHTGQKAGGPQIDI